MNLNSKKIELKSRIRLMWIVVLSILLLSIVVSCIDYSSYRKGQYFGISAQAFVIEDIIESNDTHQIKCKKLYNYFTRVYTDVTLDGIKYDYSQSRKTQDKVKEIFTEYMSVGGYHRYSKYSIENWFKYKNVFEYYFLHSSCQPFSVISYILVLIALILTFDVIRKQKRKLTIAEEILICEYNKKKIKEIMIKDVISVECSKKGLHLSGNGIKFKIHLISNADELKKLIIEKRQNFRKIILKNQVSQQMLMRSKNSKICLITELLHKRNLMKRKSNCWAPKPFGSSRKKDRFRIEICLFFSDINS